MLPTLPPLIAKAVTYLENTITGMVDQVEGGYVPAGIPLYLLEQYDLARARLLGSEVLLVAVKGDLRVAAARKALALLSRETGLVPVLVTEGLASYQRRELLNARIDFIVPDSQMYLASMLVIMRERAGHAPVAPVEAMSYAAQAMLVAALQRPDASAPWQQTQVALSAGYSKMSGTRGARELIALGLVQVNEPGTMPSLMFTASPRQVWERAGPKLRTPVLRTVHVRPAAADKLPVSLCRPAGVYGLSQVSLLAEPRTKEIAVPRAVASQVLGKADYLPELDGDAISVQQWAYFPTLGQNPLIVDPLSLQLSLRELGDPRVDACLDELLRQVFQ